MEKLTLPLVAVEQDQDMTQFTFLHRERGEKREVKWNIKKYNKGTGKWEKSEEIEKKVQGWSQEYFGVDYHELPNIVDKEIVMDIYCYDRYNYFWESQTISKFEEDMIGQLLFVTVTSLDESNKGLGIRFDYGGETYQSNMNWGGWVESEGAYFVDPNKKLKVIDNFNEKFGIPFERKEELIGKDITVEVMKNNFPKGGPWVDVKPFPKKKK